MAKYDDPAWTEPEPAGWEDGEQLADSRLIDKAYGAQPAGGWELPGGHEPQKLPVGSPSEPPVSPGGSIVAPGGAVDGVAILSLAGTFNKGDVVDIVYEAAPNAPSGAPYPVRNTSDGEAVALGWASYLRGGDGFTTEVIGNEIHFIPVPGGTVVISGLTLALAPAATAVIDEPGGVEGTVAIVSLDGTFNNGDTVSITVDVDGTETAAVVGVLEVAPDWEVASAFTQPQHLGDVAGVEVVNDNSGTLRFFPDSGKTVTIVLATVVIA